jgi:hypothetical protein
MGKTALLILAIILASSREKEGDISPAFEKENIPFEGVWARQFEAGPGNLHDVKYAVYQDSIRYRLTGPIGNADYVMLRDTFLPEDNRYVGHTPDYQYYLLFAKGISVESVTIYKQKVESMEEGLTTPVPDANTTANHGWSTYNKE